jgi:hypothetical protein
MLAGFGQAGGSAAGIDGALDVDRVVAASRLQA